MQVCQVTVGRDRMLSMIFSPIYYGFLPYTMYLLNFSATPFFRRY